MKKINYISPKTEIVELKLNNIICASYGDQPGYGGGGVPGTNEPD